MSLQSPQGQILEYTAQSLADRLPRLQLEARHIAATVQHGIHGRRKAGPGETFWQFRNFDAGDPATSIDWRRSASSSHLFVREREWEAAHTVWIWPDLSPSMNFRSHLAPEVKADRAIVLALALASLLCEAGERVGVPGLVEPSSRRNVPSLIAAALSRSGATLQGLPPSSMRLSRRSEIVIFSDFLEPLPEIESAVQNLAAQSIRGHLIQILDPAEETLPYTGRVQFVDNETGASITAERAEAMREGYQQRLREQKEGLVLFATRAGWTPFLHHTERSAAEILLALFMHLSGLDKSYRASPAAAGVTVQ